MTKCKGLSQCTKEENKRNCNKARVVLTPKVAYLIRKLEEWGVLEKSATKAKRMSEEDVFVRVLFPQSSQVAVR